MSRARWGEAKFSKGNMASETFAMRGGAIRSACTFTLLRSVFSNLHYSIAYARQLFFAFDDCLRDIIWHLFVMRELHIICSPALG